MQKYEDSPAPQALPQEKDTLAAEAPESEGENLSGRWKRTAPAHLFVPENPEKKQPPPGQGLLL
ncbi:hypothetical protein PKOR_14820 [Pontibacter korlensis]|uniref:Uncharacterized protein n=1 Tax=Pontibacter korlensis TaxID=400092 RepID=A0A0E3ZF48_9BACT|nr:hypothetical protein [Pontibacter korlensis]AKD04134.1 hypothetical protein PKOR_14820 [Pontibacter korlensis]